MTTIKVIKVTTILIVWSCFVTLSILLSGNESGTAWLAWKYLSIEKQLTPLYGLIGLLVAALITFVSLKYSDHKEKIIGCILLLPIFITVSFFILLQVLD